MRRAPYSAGYARGCDYRQSGDLGDAVWTLLEDADVLFDEDAIGFHQTVYQRLNKYYPIFR